MRFVGAALRSRCALLRSFSSAAAKTPEDSIYASGATPNLVSDLVVALLQGKGRGLVARHSFAAGDLLMGGALPLAICQGQADVEPEPQELVPALLQVAAHGSPEVSAVLRSLFDGTEKSSSLRPDLKQMMMVQQAGSGQAAVGSGGSCCDDSHDHHHHDIHAAAAAPPAPGESLVALTPQQAEAIVSHNAFGDAYEDLAAAAVRGAVPHSHVGIWPGFALANHSCLPNSLHYVVAHGMVMRAVEDIAAGQEVTVSYLGREDFSPAAARQAVLQERFGFRCSCQRCEAEQAAPPQLRALVQQVFEAVQQDLKPRFMQAVEQQDAAALCSVHAGLLQQEQLLMRQLHQAALSHSSALIHQAAVYDLFELLLFCEQLQQKSARGGAAPAEAAHAVLACLGRCLAILNCVSRGAELHVYVASRLLQHACDFRGADSPQAEAAAALLQEALLCRYGGNLEQGLMLQLMHASKQVAEEFLM